MYESILDTIGDTPVVKLNNLPKRSDVTVYAKCEYFNPMSSVKDRLAIAIIEHAEATGALAPGQTVVEATSGNTGIALAMVCAQKVRTLVRPKTLPTFIFNTPEVTCVYVWNLGLPVRDYDGRDVLCRAP